MQFKSQTKTRKFIFGLVAVGLLAGTALTVPPVVAQTTETQITQSLETKRGFSQLVERVMPSVVSVEVKFSSAANDNTGREDVPEQFRQFFDQFPQFRERFGNRMPDRRPRGGAGSGFVISEDGYVVTNNHVVAKADEVKVNFENGDSYDAIVIGTDPKTDLALLKIKSDKTFKPVPLATEEAKVGDWAIAVGNPFGLGGTVTTGIVSARGRNIGSGPYDDYLQIDASINHGNSGGPTFNVEGEVIGVNTALYSPSGGSVGIGFAIPATQVKAVVESLKTNGAVTRGWLGVRIQSVTEDLAESLNLKEARGAIVSELTEKSPAAAAGIEPGDTILSFNGIEIKDSRDLSRIVAGVKPNEEASVDLIRDGTPMTLKVTIGTMPGEMPKMAEATPDKPETTSLSALGLEVAPADDGVGVKVLEVKPNSVASEKGLNPGDIILEVAGKEVNSPSDAVKAFEAEDGKRVLMLLKEGNDQRFVALPKKEG